MPLDWIVVDSRALSAIAYDIDAEAIYVRFESGAEWRYDACTPAIWEEFSGASTSKGKYLDEA
jgi:KTSC domain